jgi:hypothetical protein
MIGASKATAKRQQYQLFGASTTTIDTGRKNNRLIRKYLCALYIDSVMTERPPADEPVKFSGSRSRLQIVKVNN